MKIHTMWLWFWAFVIISLSGCGLTPSSQLPGGLSLEEHALKEFVDSEGRDFIPVESTQEEILAKHQVERERWVGQELTYKQGTVYIETIFNGKSLVATNIYTNDDALAAVEVTLDGERIYAISAGNFGTMPPTQALWTYDDHWVLEIVHITMTPEQDNLMRQDSVGKLVQDGQMLNEQNDYQEAFGFQMLDGKPFYFFKKGDRLGLSYAGNTARLDYDEIRHYGCCSAARLNLIQAETMVSFFARKGETWYYVEIGMFD